MTTPADIDPDRFVIHRASPRGFVQAYVHERPAKASGIPVVCVHGWPETKRIYWKVIEPLVAAGHEVIVPDLRGFGDSEIGPDGFHDVASHSADLYALVHDHLGFDRVVVLGGDLGGPIIQDLALRHPEWVDRMVLFNSPLPYIKELMAQIPETRAPRESADYFFAQGTNPDRVMAGLPSAEARMDYIATFYMSRYWAHPGAFTSLPGEVDFHTEPFADAAKLRASFGAYESTFSSAARVGPALIGHNPDILTLIMFGPSDHVIYPAFDQMAAVVFPQHVGPFLLRDCGHFVPWEAPHPLVSGTVALCSDLIG